MVIGLFALLTLSGCQPLGTAQTPTEIHQASIAFGRFNPTYYPARQFAFPERPTATDNLPNPSFLNANLSPAWMAMASDILTSGNQPFQPKLTLDRRHALPSPRETPLTPTTTAYPNTDRPSYPENTDQPLPTPVGSSPSPKPTAPLQKPVRQGRQPKTLALVGISYEPNNPMAIVRFEAGGRTSGQSRYVRVGDVLQPAESAQRFRIVQITPKQLTYEKHAGQHSAPFKTVTLTLPDIVGFPSKTITDRGDGS